MQGLMKASSVIFGTEIILVWPDGMYHMHRARRGDRVRRIRRMRRMRRMRRRPLNAPPVNLYRSGMNSPSIQLYLTRCVRRHSWETRPART